MHHDFHARPARTASCCLDTCPPAQQVQGPDARPHPPPARSSGSSTSVHPSLRLGRDDMVMPRKGRTRRGCRQAEVHPWSDGAEMEETLLTEEDTKPAARLQGGVAARRRPRRLANAGAAPDQPLIAFT
uniref:Uncharacterized protein n=1 Tax=Oryza brachyantha TaxID=4533 RepID=J3L0Q2_ORYBR